MLTRSNASPQARARAEQERRRREQAGEVDNYTAFRAKYRNDPFGFVMDCFQWEPGEGPAPYQIDALQMLAQSRRVSIRGPHGLGKSALASWIILWFALVTDGDSDWKIPTTASAWRQLTKFLWPEIHKWGRRLRWNVIGRPAFNQRTEFLDMSLKLKTGEAFALASDNPAMIEGAHAKRLLYVFDESKGINPDIWDAAEGAFSTGDCYFLAISTPGEPNGRFYEIHKRQPGYEDWWTRHVTKEEVVSSGRMSEAWAEQRRKQWGEHSAVYQNRVLGEFAASDEDGIIALAWVEASNLRWSILNDANAWEPLSRIGVDVGRGGDPSILARRHGRAIKAFDEMNERDVMAVAGKVHGILEGADLENITPSVQAVVDVIGIGAGVVDRLRETFGKRIYGFNSSEGTNRRDASNELGFVNERSATWWELREMLQDGLIDLPPDDILIGEFTAPHYKQMSGGRIQVESKEDIKKRLHRSTNRADAAIMAFWKKPARAGGWARGAG